MTWTELAQVISLILGAFVSEDASVISAALLISAGQLAAPMALSGALLGIFFSDLLVVVSGRLFAAGRELSWMRWARPPQGRLETAAGWLRRHSIWVVVLSRFVPGTRVPVCFAAGFLQLPIRRFMAVLLLAATVWSTTAVFLVIKLGHGFDDEGPIPYSRFVLIGILVISVMALSARVIGKLLDPVEARLLGARWHRITHFEFWPVWAAYLPVFLAIPFWMIRYRCLMPWSAVNPALPLGGLRGESKQAILEMLGAAGAPVPPWVAIPQGALEARMATVINFADANWPVVLKPDVGERGKAVAVIRSPEDARTYLAAHPGCAIAQRFVPGEEFGILFERDPLTSRLHITSIHGKRFPIVTGDGQRSLSELIFAHPRGPLQWKTFQHRLGDAMAEVPQSGQNVPFTEIGNHCLGTEFLDRRDLNSPQLLAAIERFAARLNGFYLGRLDVRAPDAAAISNGRFTILELNGVSSEPGHIYDPAGSILHGWSQLLRHWNRACQIGAVNRSRGTPTAPLRELVRALRG